MLISEHAVEKNLMVVTLLSLIKTVAKQLTSLHFCDAGVIFLYRLFYNIFDIDL